MASSTIYVIVTAEALARPPAGWKPCLAQTGTLCCLQGFGPLLTEALLQYGVIGTDKRGEAQPAPSTAAAYNSTGLPAAGSGRVRGAPTGGVALLCPGCFAALHEMVPGFCAAQHARQARQLWFLH